MNLLVVPDAQFPDRFRHTVIAGRPHHAPPRGNPEMGDEIKHLKYKLECFIYIVSVNHTKFAVH